MAWFISLRFAGFGRPSIQKASEELCSIGREPSVAETASTPGMDSILSSNARRRARVSAELVVGDAGSDKLKVIAWLGLKPGLTRQSAARLRIISPAPTSKTKAMATSTATKIP